MKKLTYVIVSTIMLLLLMSCGEVRDVSLDTDETELPYIYSDDSIEYTIPLPEHIPGTIRLFENPQEEFFVAKGSFPEFRVVWYIMEDYVINLVPYEDWVVFRDTVLTANDNNNTMPLVAFIQYFNISREEMEYAIMRLSETRMELINTISKLLLEEQQLIEMAIAHTEVEVFPEIMERFENREELAFGEFSIWIRYDPIADPMHEVNEIPNLDIIFTFDNDIINRFYRR